ncbi:ABC transporter substrate-binding protein [Jannaschia pohangensis]|uniref:Iron(III) transport system substrate-binding protein n=1 Tax=Jannaschia pohangensis TaxID=390807 RepID=A0A1I3J4M1_9RHOB|nr:ABC transporter substrate-binding protein [Jannaschia pohangensis]SFI55261.1 iron(III) transport system substrate-binding protein [Jannaschia pohangensis]
MRHALSALLILWSAAAAAQSAFEIEEERLFDAPGTAVVRIVSTTDTDLFAPIVTAFQAANPEIDVHYTTAATTEVHRAVESGAAFDLAISSAMDLQMKLANDGLALPAPGPADWPRLARWRDEVWAFAQEPVVAAFAPRAFEGMLPRTRSDLIDALRRDPERFQGKVGTYDPNRSGAGYLFATQDARQSDTSWRLAEVMGGLDPRLYASTAAMLRDLREGRILVAYNLLGSYATADGFAGVEMLDFTHVLLRTALVPRSAPAPDLGRAFLRFLLSPEGQAAVAATGLPPIDADALTRAPHLRPIRLDAGLLVYVDPLVRGRFLREWTEAVRQP